MTEDQYFWIGLSVIGGMILFALLTLVDKREPEPPRSGSESALSKNKPIYYEDDDD